MMRVIKQRYVRLLIVVLLLLIVVSFFAYKKPRRTQRDSMENHEWSDIDVVYYINLDHRQDRRDQFLAEMAKVGIPQSKIVRIDAVAEPKRGDLGCSKSHVKTMETFMASPYENCIVFEDDFEWQRSPNEVKAAFREFFLSFPNKEGYDVMMLSANEVRTDETDRSWLRRVIDVQTTAGFMVNRRFAPTLLDNFKEGAKQLEAGYERDKPDAPQYAVDQFWKRLQPDAEWFMFYPKLGKQRASTSDIAGGQWVDYGV